MATTVGADGQTIAKSLVFWVKSEFSGREIIATGEAEHTRRSSEILYVSWGVSGPK